MRIRSASVAVLAGIVAASLALGACAPKKPPVARPLPPPPPPTTQEAPPPPPPAPVAERPVVAPPPIAEDPMMSRSVDELNRDSPMRVAYFGYDSAELSAEARAALDANAAILKKYPTWTVTVEGHCDERGTAEYNLALGERRAVAAQSYLVALGIPASRVKIVSYGKEFPFDPGHDDAAWTKNRRAHFVITGK
ncbi:MAG: peptidoglycan-associated lipoprotein Pal [Vicinamibacterales bacterium]|nr:peptidoglycan-associated lipoprotein Pal [Vicinamibacterales bacterium]